MDLTVIQRVIELLQNLFSSARKFVREANGNVLVESFSRHFFTNYSITTFYNTVIHRVSLCLSKD